MAAQSKGNSSGKVKIQSSSGVSTKSFSNVGAGSTSFLNEGESNGAVINCGNTYNVQNTWFRVKPSKTGVMIITQTSSGHIRLYNSKKKALSDDIYVNGGSSVNYMQYTVFGVQADKTYYVRVSSAGNYYGSSKSYVNAVAYQSNKSTGSYGKSASKASKLKKGKTRNGYMLSKGSPKYYKFTKKGKVAKVYIDGMTDKKIKVTVTAKAKGYRTYKRTMYLYNSENSDNTSKMLKLTIKKTRTMKVTIKVDGDGNSSGAYSVKCK
jgi:hypothetical protein